MAVSDLALPCVCLSFDELKKELEKEIKALSPRKIAILCDSNTLEHCYPKIADFSPFKEAEILEVSPGEESKSLEVASSLWNTLLDYGFHRSDLLIGLGGGMITDLTGFIASTYKRGMKSVFLPTSLLGMVDAAIGGKNGINFGGAKNQIGTITPEFTVMVCEAFLDTLPEREVKAGAIESLKHGMIADSSLFDAGIQDLLALRKTENLLASIKVKQEVTRRDPYEKNTRKALNFGHTVGHAFESAAKGNLLHGEAIAFGLWVETYLSVQEKGMRKQWLAKLKNLLVPHFPLWKSAVEHPKAISEYLRFDKKNTSEKINFTLLTAIGNPETDCELPETAVEQAITKVWQQL